MKSLTPQHFAAKIDSTLGGPPGSSGLLSTEEFDFRPFTLQKSKSEAELRCISEPSCTDGVRGQDQVRNSDCSGSSSGPPSQLMRTEAAGIATGVTPGPGQTPQGHKAWCAGRVASVPWAGGRG